MKYIVMCRVSGGVTGTRQAPLKVYNPNRKPGELAAVRYFDTVEEAEAAAHVERTHAYERRQYSTAGFSYWVEPA